MNLSKDISDIYEIIIRKQMFSVLCKNGFVYIASSDDLESTQEYIPLTKIMGKWQRWFIINQLRCKRNKIDLVVSDYPQVDDSMDIGSDDEPPSDSEYDPTKYM